MREYQRPEKDLPIIAVIYPQYIKPKCCQKWQYPPNLPRVPAVPAISNPELIGVQAV